MKRFILIDCENIGTPIPKKTITDSKSYISLMEKIIKMY